MSDRVGTIMSVTQAYGICGCLRDGRSGAHVDASVPQHAVRRPGQALAEPGQHPVGRVDQQPPRLMARQPRVVSGELRRHECALGGDLGAGVARADNDEGQPSVSLRRIIGAIREFQLQRDVIPQEQRLGNVAKAVGILRDTGDGQKLVDAAGREEHLIVAERGRSALRVDICDQVSGDIDVLGGAEYQPDLLATCPGSTR